MKYRRGAVLWRAQLGVKYVLTTDVSGEELIEVPKGFSGDRMKPIGEFAGEGRANSSGIPVLYLASTEKTAISEVRPWVGSQVSVAQFKVSRNLNAIDLTQGHGESIVERFDAETTVGRGGTGCPGQTEGCLDRH